MVVMVRPLSPLNQSGLLTNTGCQRDFSTGPRSGRRGDTNKNNTERYQRSSECFHYAGQKQAQANRSSEEDDTKQTVKEPSGWRRWRKVNN